MATVEARRIVGVKPGGLVVLALALAGMSSASGSSTRPAAKAVLLRSTFAPRIDRTDHGAAVRYELEVANSGPAPVRLMSLTVRGTAQAGQMLHLTGARLRAALAPRSPGCDAEGARLQPGATCTLFVDAAMRRGDTAGKLETILRYAVGSGVADTGIGLIARDDSSPALGPPLGGGTWVAVHHPDWPRGHRRVFYQTPRGRVLPGCFAIDFVEVAATGATACGDADKPANALGYGKPVLAVATGRIVALRDDMPESASVSANGRHGPAAAAGNYVVLALQPGRYAIYEHLRPGSIRVRVGDLVRRGMPIAALGFTGDSTGPHLHFHVSDAIDPSEGEGLPFTFDRYTLLGDYPDISLLGKSPWRAETPRTTRRLRPGPDTVISFAPGAGGAYCR